MTTTVNGLAMKSQHPLALPMYLITMVTGLATRQPSDSTMLFSAIILSIVMPMQIALNHPRFELFIVQATIDAAVIAGIPASKAAKKYALQSQKPDFLMVEAHLASEPVSWRRLYFRKLFS